MEFNTADVIIVITILLSTALGIYRGFVREVLTVITWIVAAVIAYIYGQAVGEYLVFFKNAAVREALGMVVVFAGVVLVGYIIKLIVIKAGKLGGVTTVDRIVGALFGVLRGCVLVVLVLLLSSNNINEQDWYKKSKLLPKFAKAADITSKATPESWKEDIKREVDEIMQAEQSPAPVTAAEPSTVTDVTVTVEQTTTTVTEEVAPAADKVAPAATTTTPTTKTEKTDPAKKPKN